MRQWTWISQCTHCTRAAHHRCVSSGDRRLVPKLQPQLRGSTGKLHLGLLSYSKQEDSGKEQPSTALRGTDMSAQMHAGSYRCLCSKCSLIAKQTGQTGFTTLHLCSGFRGWYSQKSCKLQMFLSVEHVSTYFYFSSTAQLDLSSYLCEGAQTVTDWHYLGSHINLAAPAAVEKLTP